MMLNTLQIYKSFPIENIRPINSFLNNFGTYAKVAALLQHVPHIPLG